MGVVLIARLHRIEFRRERRGQDTRCMTGNGLAWLGRLLIEP